MIEEESEKKEVEEWNQRIPKSYNLYFVCYIFTSYLQGVSKYWYFLFWYIKVYFDITMVTSIDFLDKNT